MQLKKIFTKKKKYAAIPTEKAKQDIPEGLVIKCEGCAKIYYEKEWKKHLNVCPSCELHHKMTAFERIESLVDEGSFKEWDQDVETTNPLDFPDYDEKLKKDQEKTGLKDAVVIGEAAIEELPVAIVVMDPRFRMASMGAVVGEKIARTLEIARKKKLPVIIFTASGGARMQEGMISLMQMAKTSIAIERFDRSGGCLINVMTNPTTGGVTASFASIGDYHFAEPQALIGFAGRRIIEQTIREKLPQSFQTAEFQLEHGQVDRVVHRLELKELLTKVLKMHRVRSDES
ncbi:acetyl-CoA carboxylase carboxyltransferase subunit alpha [Pelagirhabdus alkalitolerans]|uniref:Acetyl-coenzyme A carboxylase carboxyl transferase subunit beta n=1 Tax=Pelagirhabdus alkalitolerans TaxID=1612202 RepID=A0A1G6HK02_9BACI|nr:acetyl-CoA carboxylase, carboxyltransferase subunit beta [Pelagirhabdus alkalitolerans]SDB94521.1 acetyl-CoA carboxylase carboxyltransferase subunit alpha [Pelagirhabdus alkalitolerans]